VLRNIHFKQFTLMIVSLGFLTTNVGYAWNALPSTPNCESESTSVTDGHHSNDHRHANMPHEPTQTDAHSNDTHVSMNNMDSDVCDCNGCQDFYEALFSYLLVADIEVPQTTPLLAVEGLYPNSNNHIPDPYQPPPA